MALKSIVKVSHLSNLSDARFCSGMGVDLLGFNVIPGTSGYMTSPIFQEIRGWLAGPKIIAEIYGVSSTDQIREVLETYAPDYFELSWEEYQTYRDHLTLPCIVHTTDPAALIQQTKEERIEYVTTEATSECDDIAGSPYPILVRIHSLGQLHEKMRAACFTGYVLEGPQQVKAGITSYDELGSILEALEED